MKSWRIVITWSINSGKTEIIKELSARWYTIVEESAIMTIKILQEKLGGVEEQKQWIQQDFQSWLPSEFHKMNIDQQMSSESSIDLDKITFLDRGLLDYKAFCLLRDLPFPEGSKFLFENRQKYDQVFISESLPVFDTREWSWRIIDEALAKKMWEFCRKVYTEAGYTLTDIPALDKDNHKSLLTVEQRTDFVLENMK